MRTAALLALCLLLTGLATPAFAERSATAVSPADTRVPMVPEPTDDPSDRIPPKPPKPPQR